MSDSNLSSKEQVCSVCGAGLSAVAGGMCPRCLMAEAARATEARGTGVANAAPSKEEVTAAFPQFEIIELIGTGGMGTVWRARQPNLDRHVALKLLPASLAERDPAFAERFEREGQLLARLHHPNIVTVHDSGRAGNFFYLVMEFVDGVNLRQAMRASRFTSQQALTIVPRICDALQYAHEEGVLHRDIKPENILLDLKGRVKLVDFGIAKVMALPETVVAGAVAKARASAGNSLTVGDSTLGTPNYMAPEQIAKPADVDHRADIYSLGVVFYELLTGELPQAKFASPSEKYATDPRLDDIVRQALEKERSRRQQSVAEVRTQVETVVGTAAAAPQPDGVEAEEARRPWRIPHVVLRDGQPVIRWPVVLNTLAFQFGLQTALVLLIWTMTGFRFPLDYSLLLVSVNALMITGMEVGRAWSVVAKPDEFMRKPRVRLAIQLALAITAAVATCSLFFLLSRSAQPALAVTPEPAPVVQPAPSVQVEAPVPVEPPVPPVQVIPKTAPARVVMPEPAPGGLLYRTEFNQRIEALAYSPDGKFLAVGGDGPKVTVLDARIGAALFELTLISPDEEAILKASNREVSEVRVRALKYSPDSSVLAVGTSIGLVKLFDPKTGAFRVSLDGGPKKGATEAKDNKLLALRRAMNHAWQLAFSADGALLAVGGEAIHDEPDDQIRRLRKPPRLSANLQIWDVKTGALKKELAADENQITDLVFSPNGKILASAGVGGREERGNVVKIWDVETGEKKRVIPSPGGPLSGESPHSLAMSPDGKLLAIGIIRFDKNTDQSSGSIAVVRTGSGILELNWPVPRAVGSLAFAPGGWAIAALNGTNMLRMWDAGTGQLLNDIRPARADQEQRWEQFSISEKAKVVVISGMTPGKGGFVEARRFEGLLPHGGNPPGGNPPKPNEGGNAPPPPRPGDNESAPPAPPKQGAVQTPREVVAEFLRFYKIGQQGGGYEGAVALTTRRTFDLVWNMDSTEPEEYDRIRPMHQLSTADHAMVMSNVFREKGGAKRVFHAFLLKKDGRWMIDSMEFSAEANIRPLMRGFAANPLVKFDLIPEELVGEWGALCQSATEVKADGTGFQILFGPPGPEPGQKPEAFQWEVNGPIWVRRFADREERLEAKWITDEIFQFAGPGESEFHSYREDRPKPAAPVLIPPNEVVERVLAGAAGSSEKNALDFETGTITTLPMKATKDAMLGNLGVRMTAAFSWITRGGYDVAGWTEGEAPGLMGFEAVFKKVDGAQWEAPKAEEIGRMLEGLKAETPSEETVIRQEGGVPTTYAFRTRDGAVGVLQILGAGEKAKTVKVRYKRVEASKPAGLREN
jgi:serine/threonine protein kinase/WD40 repeat protein